jgi:hypothetical protein
VVIEVDSLVDGRVDGGKEVDRQKKEKKRGGRKGKAILAKPTVLSNATIRYICP